MWVGKAFWSEAADDVVSQDGEGGCEADQRPPQLLSVAKAVAIWVARG